MARSLTTAQRTAVRADHVIECILVRMDLDATTLRFALAGNHIKSGGQTWYGAGALASMDAIEEGIELQSRGIRFRLSGVPASLVSAALSEPIARRRVTVFTVFYGRDTHKAIGDPIVEWSGLLDVMLVITAPREA